MIKLLGNNFEPLSSLNPDKVFQKFESPAGCIATFFGFFLVVCGMFGLSAVGYYHTIPSDMNRIRFFYDSKSVYSFRKSEVLGPSKAMVRLQLEVFPWLDSIFAHIKKRLKSVMVFTYSRFNSCCLWSLELLHLFQARNPKKVTNMIILPKIAYPLIFRHDLVTNHGRRATRVIPFKAKSL